MIALDSSAFARFLDGVSDEFTRRVASALQNDEAHFPPVVLTELFSNARLTDIGRARIERIPLLPLHPGYWRRAGLLRADVRRSGLKANLPDVLIAQTCIDNDVPLITYDRDFRHFADAGLKLA